MKDINDLYSLVSTGSLSKKEALDILVVYISKNPVLFGLIGYDEDFRSDLILLILEKGDVLFKNYNKTNGSFFTYLYCYIKSTILVLIKHLHVSKYHEYFDFCEGIETYNESQISYLKNEFDWIEQNFVTNNEIIQSDFQKKDDFFSIDETPLEKLKKTSPLLAKKIVLVLILKSSYYITDTQINKLCETFELDKEDILNKVQKLKNSLSDKIDRKHCYEERRNNAYYRKKKYANKIEDLKEKNDDSSLIKKDVFEKKFEKTTKCWKNLNEKLQSGFRNIRPTNKVVANLTGICERQVSYYIKNAKELDINSDKENNNKK